MPAARARGDRSAVPERLTASEGKKGGMQRGNEKSRWERGGGWAGKAAVIRRACPSRRAARRGLNVAAQFRRDQLE